MMDAGRGFIIHLDLMALPDGFIREIASVEENAMLRLVHAPFPLKLKGKTHCKISRQVFRRNAEEHRISGGQGNRSD